MQATHSKENSGSGAKDFIRQFPIATLITTYHNRPYASHLPFLILDSKDSLILASYLKKVNKQWKHLEFEDALIIFQSPAVSLWDSNLAISSEMEKEEANALHLYGQCNFINERKKAEQVYLNILQDFDENALRTWENSNPLSRDEIFSDVIVFEMKVETIEVVQVPVQSSPNSVSN